MRQVWIGNLCVGILANDQHDTTPACSNYLRDRVVECFSPINFRQSLIQSLTILLKTSVTPLFLHPFRFFLYAYNLSFRQSILPTCLPQGKRYRIAILISAEQINHAAAPILAPCKHGWRRCAWPQSYRSNPISVESAQGRARSKWMRLAPPPWSLP